MKLYELPRNTHFTIDGDRTIYLFHHIDGMYSFCTDERGVVYHFAAWTEISPLKE